MNTETNINKILEKINKQLFEMKVSYIEYKIGILKICFRHYSSFSGLRITFYLKKYNKNDYKYFSGFSVEAKDKKELELKFNKSFKNKFKKVLLKLEKMEKQFLIQSILIKSIRNKINNE